MNNNFCFNTRLRSLAWSLHKTSVARYSNESWSYCLSAQGKPFEFHISTFFRSATYVVAYGRTKLYLLFKILNCTFSWSQLWNTRKSRISHSRVNLLVISLRQTVWVFYLAPLFLLCPATCIVSYGRTRFYPLFKILLLYLLVISTLDLSECLASLKVEST